ncbi:TolC-like type I secretion outer membrane protein with type I periplasmic ligand-binding domain [Psychroflexus torquis ATCC 700755]|uniref:TolC-like type I secretion outer membrane protein with type I periplasmic ligand-binding domain n=1 Tax=Psychroflexus torquis (strain ATCC 700755 / CIP 106069 / ACAM 623) TaxID=313595 RepID=K4IMV3_PSYTT|nr:TolC-like type I secretion outer membrane protein with type I periplasmic ligand-binding domain [Psychroflexus torquis ATCC 700755]
MKKHIILIFCFYFFQFLSAQQKTYNIGILLDTTSEETELLVKKLENEIKATVGQDAIINFQEKKRLVNNYSLSIAQQQYTQLLNDDTDIILALGVVTGQMINQQKSYIKPTILFGVINADINILKTNQITSNVNNFTYILEQDSYKKDLEQLKSLTNFKKVGVLIEQAFIDVLPIKTTLDAIFKDLDASYVIIPLNEATNTSSALNAVDAVYLAGGFTMQDTNIKSLAKTLIEKGLPSFTINNSTQVDLGIMATNNSLNDYNQIIRRLALTVESYTSGNPLSEMKVLMTSKVKLSINYNTAEAVGVPIKYSLVNEAAFLGKFDNVVPDEKYTLVEAINKVLKKNISIQAVKEQVKLSGQDLKTAKNNYLPEIVASGAATYIDPDVAELGFGQSPEFQTLGSINLQQTLFSEQANATININKNLQKAEQQVLKAEELNIVFEVCNVYLNILILKVNAELQHSNLKVTKKNYDIAEQNFEAGFSGKSDMFRFKSEIAQNTQALVEAVNQIEQEIIQLNQLLNNPIDAKIDIEDASLELALFNAVEYDTFKTLLDSPVTRRPFVHFLIEQAQLNAPELKVVDYNIKAIERTVSLNGKGRLLPTIGLQAQYNTVFNRNGVGSTSPEGFGFTLPNTNYNVGVTVSIPIFNRNQTQTNKQTALIQKEQLTLNRENSELAISSNVNTNILNVINRMTNIDLSRVSAEAARESLSLTQTSYSNGAINIVQLIDAQNNYLNAQLNKTTAVYSYLLSTLTVERSIGHFFLLNDTKANAAFTSKFLEFQKNHN